MVRDPTAIGLVKGPAETKIGTVKEIEIDVGTATAIVEIGLVTAARVGTVIETGTVTETNETGDESVVMM
jgi:hypothetical protein